MTETETRAPEPIAPSSSAIGGRRLRPLITQARADELRAERDRLRRRLEVDFADRLRAAREFGAPSENDEYLQIKEEEAVLAAGLARVSTLLDEALVLDEADHPDGVAAIGTTVEVEFTDTGERRDFQLISGHERLASNVASAGSPIGRALMGAAPGAEVVVRLPRGQQRTMKLLSVARPGG